MSVIGDNTISINYIKDGSQKTETINHSSDIHSLKGYYSNSDEPFVVRGMTIGKNLSCYGRVATTINNQNITNYQHFNSGVYKFKIPIVFITFHLVKV
jgi:hypothetical protein